MDCQYCGEATQPGAVFCGSCGQKLPTTPVTASTPTTPPAKLGHKRTVIALLLGVFGLPLSLVPIVGLAAGVSGLVLATTARKHYKGALSWTAIIISGLAAMAALVLWVYLVQQDPRIHHSL